MEASRGGRRLLSVLLVATLAAVVVWNVPEPPVRALARPVVEPFVNTAGLDQRWNLFAPDPPRRTTEVVARIEYADGGLTLWEPPRNDRWRKWLGTITNEAITAYWGPTAAWIADHHGDGGRQAVRVELIQRWRDLSPPGPGAVEEPWQQSVFFTYVVPTGGR
jgi:hypothetical protein